MNYLPLSGYWFYGALNSTEMAAYFGSYGLLDEAPEPVVSSYFSPFTGIELFDIFRGAINKVMVGRGLICRALRLYKTKP